MALEMARTIVPSGPFRGVIQVPGDKSISHRSAMLGGLAKGRCVIDAFLCSEDCLNTLRAVETLGAKVSRDGCKVTIEGTSGFYYAPDKPLDMGNSGTGMRLLAGILAGHDFLAELTGDSSLLSRPMRRIKEPLELMGAVVECRGRNGRGPLRIRGGHLTGISYRLPVASAQVKSCVLLAGLFANGTTTVIEPLPTRNHTEKMFAALRLPISVSGLEISIRGYGPGGPSIPCFEILVPGDFSSAAYWLAGAAATAGSDVIIRSVGLNPRRTALVGVLQRMGAEIQIVETDCSGFEPCGDIHVRGSTLKGTEVGGDQIPNLIDEIPVLAAIGALARGVTVIRDAEELRVKESDRIAAMADGLSVMGVHVETFRDGMAVRGGGVVRQNVVVNSRGDHRIAMSLAVLACAAGCGITIQDTACVATSYPAFWSDLQKLTGAHVGTSYSD